MAKSADAFRTISEVSEWLNTPAHVLRFWESKFSQIKPVKRAGGRRYYRPSDMELLGGIKRLLHEDGMTIKGTQKLLREKGIAHVSALSQPLDDVTAAVRDAMDGKALKEKAEREAAAKAADPLPAEAPAPGDAPETTATASGPQPVDLQGDTTPDAPLPFDAPPRTLPAGGQTLRAVPSPVTEPEPAEPEVVLDRISPLSALYKMTTPLPPEAAALRTRLQIWVTQDLA